MSGQIVFSSNSFVLVVGGDLRSMMIFLFFSRVGLDTTTPRIVHRTPKIACLPLGSVSSFSTRFVILLRFSRACPEVRSDQVKR